MPLPTGTWDAYGPGTDLAAWQNYYKFWKAAMQRTMTLGSRYFPRTNEDWSVVGGTGIISSMTPTSMTDNGANWPTNRWRDYFEPDVPEDDRRLPRNYDLIIYADAYDEPWKIVRSFIQTNGNKTIHFLDVGLDATDLGEFINKRYAIVKQWGLWWHERIPLWPNPKTYLSSSATSVGPGTIQDSIQRWPVNKWVGQRVAFTRNGRTRTGLITANTADILTFTSTHQPSPGTRYSIYKPLGTIPPIIGNAGPTPAWQWTGGPQNYKMGHAPWDDITSQPLVGAGGIALNGVQWLIYPEPGTFGEIEIEDRYLFDVDLWTGLTEKAIQSPSPDTSASGPDTCYTPYFYRAWRSLQVWVETVCSSFIEMKGWTSFGSPFGFPTLSVAKLFSICGINSGTGVMISHKTEYVSGEFIRTATLRLGNAPYYPIRVHYEIQRPNGEIAGHGTTVQHGPTVDVSGHGMSPEDAGNAVIFSYGWSRKVPKEFATMFDSTHFMPDAGESGEPDLNEPGTYVTTPKSTGYREAIDESSMTYDDDANAWVGENLGKVIESPRFLFQEGDVARYSGHNFRDTSTDLTEADSWAVYEDRGTFQGQYRKWPVALSGLATEAGAGFLTCSSLNLLQWGVMRNETGTATSGDATHLTDITKAGNGRWTAATGRWIGFVLTLTKGGVTKKTRVTGFSEGTQTLTFVACGITVDNTTTYSIEEPAHRLNRFKDRKLRITRASTTTAVVIVAHDNDTLFWNEAFVSLPGDSFEIVDPRFGTIWLRSGGQWVEPLGFPQTMKWYGNVVAIGRPHIRTMYGRAMKGDYEPSPTELKNTMNKLQWTPIGYSWTNKGEKNVRSGAHGGGGPIGPTRDTWVDADVYFAGKYWRGEEFVLMPGDPFYDQYGEGSGTWTEGDGVKPQAAAEISYDFTGVHGAGRGSSYAYGRASPHSLLSCVVDFYVWATLRTTPFEENTDSWPDKVQYKGPVPKDRWVLWASQGGTGERTTGARLGSLDPPDYVDLPYYNSGPPFGEGPGQIPGMNAWAGYDATFKQGIARWQGLTFV